MSQSKQKRKLSRNILNKAISTICRERMTDENNEIIITVNEVAAVLETDYDIDVDPITVRRRGFHNRGYYERKYSNICSYNQIGDTRMRGLIVKPEEFIEEVGS